MASFIKRNGRWTARIRKTGYPETTQTFASKASALLWSQRVECEPEKFLSHQPQRITSLRQWQTFSGSMKEKSLLRRRGETRRGTDLEFWRDLSSFLRNSY